MGKALADGYRDKVRVATKLPVWAVEKSDDFDRYLDEQRQRLQTNFIDFYLLHNLHEEAWAKMKRLKILNRAERAMSDGKIGRIGFSFHDRFDVFRKILDEYDSWSICQIQYNYLCEDVQAGTQGLEYAAARGIGVVVMEPLMGGVLADPPARMKAVWESAGGDRSPAEWALQWLWNKPEVSLVLSGMNAMPQVRENVTSAERSNVGSLSAPELARYEQANRIYAELNPVPCTKCRYCMPCPQGVDIPRNFELYNEGAVFQGNPVQLNRNIYKQMIATARAESCTQCRECEEKCPQSIPISEWMPKVHAELSGS